MPRRSARSRSSGDRLASNPNLEGAAARSWNFEPQPWHFEADPTPPKVRLVKQGIAWASRNFAAVDAEGVELVDPLQRLFDPAFTDLTWEYENSKIGEIPGKLHAKQLELYVHRAIHRWALWGNQSGKTTLGAVDVVMCSLGRHPLQLSGLLRMPPFTSWASALTWELWEKILLPELLTWIPPGRIVGDPPPAFRQSTKRDIIVLGDNGRESRITGKAAQQGPQAYQSARVNLVWLDEEHPEAVWDEMQPRLLRFGGRTLATMTPLLGMTYVHGRMYEPVKTGRIPPTRHFYSHAGVADNPGINKESIAEMTEELKHNPSQLESRLHGHFTRPTGAVLPWDPEVHLTKEPLAPADPRMTLLRLRGAWYGALDLGKWRFHFQFGVADKDANFLLIDEYFSQNEDVDVRAKAMHALVVKLWRIPAGEARNAISIPADCADPVGIKELNEAFERIDSPLRVYAIEAPLKNVKAGISRVESMMNRGAFKVRRGMGADMQWRLGKNAASGGHPMMGSRWMWEAANWQYPKAEDGKVQKDEPDDKSADGADAMDGTRYLMMQFFPADAPTKPKKTPTRAERLQKELEDLDRDEQRPTDREKYGGVLRQ